MNSLWQRLVYAEISVHFRPFRWRWEFVPWAPGNSVLRVFVGPFGVMVWRLA